MCKSSCYVLNIMWTINKMLHCQGKETCLFGTASSKNHIIIFMVFWLKMKCKSPHSLRFPISVKIIQIRFSLHAADCYLLTAHVPMAKERLSAPSQDLFEGLGPWVGRVKGKCTHPCLTLFPCQALSHNLPRIIPLRRENIFLSLQVLWAHICIFRRQAHLT